MVSVGWGTTSYWESSSDVLLEVMVPVVTQDQCKASMGSSIHDGMICAGGVAGDIKYLIYQLKLQSGQLE